MVLLLQKSPTASPPEVTLSLSANDPLLFTGARVKKRSPRFKCCSLKSRAHALLPARTRLFSAYVWLTASAVTSRLRVVVGWQLAGASGSECPSVSGYSVWFVTLQFVKWSTDVSIAGGQGQGMDDTARDCFL